jgi:hypothetical protein
MVIRGIQHQLGGRVRSIMRQQGLEATSGIDYHLGNSNWSRWQGNTIWGNKHITITANQSNTVGSHKLKPIQDNYKLAVPCRQRRPIWPHTLNSTTQAAQSQHAACVLSTPQGVANNINSYSLCTRKLCWYTTTPQPNRGIKNSISS